MFKEVSIPKRTCIASGAQHTRPNSASLWYGTAMLKVTLSSTGKQLSASESEPSATGQQVLSGLHFPRRMDLGVGHPVPAPRDAFPSSYKLSLSMQTANKKPTIQPGSLAMATSPLQDTELTSFTVHSSHEEFLSPTVSRCQLQSYGMMKQKP